ncbi:MAG: 1,6-anhydro-N-acetylmuramyl-L-alanine amidase AmpD [Mariprofundaceae bacterium]|nr:1,6-anhydro-N-acetylmuramyl-L-alanine amidase AmpD [Mariprofundaceae bacterium]
MIFKASPHHDDRPKNMPIELIVLHAISLPQHQFTTQHIIDLFLGQLDHNAHPGFDELRDLQVSAHFLIDRQGQIIQFVPCQKRAWHAGVSQWKSRQQCNDFSIGIEMIGDEEQAFSAQQYQCCAQLCHSLQHLFPSISDITGHENIAPVRKWDPGKQWDWPLFHHIKNQGKHTILDVI